MEFLQHYMIPFVILGVLATCGCLAQSPEASISPARALDSLLQGYAYRAFVRPRTGVVYHGTVPSNLTGISVEGMRLRSGSLRRRRVKYEEFDIPTGVIVNPYVERLVLVYQNLGNWTSFYYPLSGFSYLAPMLGLLSYDAANLSATNLPELDLVVSGSPISISFKNVVHVPSGFTGKCVWFGLDGSFQLMDLVSTNVCSTYRQGHYSIVVNSTALAPAPSPNEGPGQGPGHGGGKSKWSLVWKIVVGVVGGLIGLALLAFLVFWVLKYIQKKRITGMEQQADGGVALQMRPIGSTQAPIATGTRTQPVLENEYSA